MAEADEVAGGAISETPSGGGFGAWLPLIITLVVMPALAYVMTTFVLLPKVEKVISISAGHEKHGEENGNVASHSESDSHAGGSQDGGHGASHGSVSANGDETSPNTKVTSELGKVLVNLAGSMGSRYLLANITLVGKGEQFQSIVEGNKAQLLDIASSSLAAKTISDLEKPGARNQVRTELIMLFNSALGGGTVKEIYLTEFAIQ